MLESASKSKSELDNVLNQFGKRRSLLNESKFLHNKVFLLKLTSNKS